MDRVLKSKPEATFNQRGWKIPSLDAVLYSSMGLLILLIGSWIPDDRLNVSGLPLDLIIMLAAAVLATTGSIRYVTLKSIAILQIPLLFLGITIFWSTDPDIGIDRLTTLLVSGNIGYILLNTVVEKHGADQFAKLIIFYLGILLLIAIPYKIANGFFERSVSFFINGPIVFARLMSIAALLSLFYLRGRTRKIAIFIFFLAIVWTESKGPILAILVTFFFIAFFYAEVKTRRKFIAYFALFVIGLIFIF